MMITLDYKLMSFEEKKFVDNLIRASIFDIVKPEEADQFIEDGSFTTIDDIHTVYNDGINFYHINAMVDVLSKIQMVHRGVEN